jgi:hypothetical protein
MGGCRGGGGRQLGDWRERGDTDAGELGDRAGGCLLGPHDGGGTRMTRGIAGTTAVVVDWEGRAVGRWLKQSKSAAHESTVPRPGPGAPRVELA